MNRNPEVSQTLGEIIAASCELGVTIIPDGQAASELAGRHLERVLLRGSNARITIALADLARELEPFSFGRERVTV